MRLFYGSHCPTEQANLNLLTLSKDSNLSPVPLPPVRRKRQARWFKADAEFTITTICSAEHEPKKLARTTEPDSEQPLRVPDDPRAEPALCGLLLIGE
jgi:hypothetical protein